MADLLREISSCTDNEQLSLLKARVSELNRKPAQELSSYERKKLYDSVRSANKAIEEADNRINLDYFRFEGDPVAPKAKEVEKTTELPKRSNATSLQVADIDHEEVNLDTVVNAGHVNIKNIQNSTLANHEIWPGSIHLDSVHNSTLTLSTRGPLMAKHISNSKLIVNCHQLRLHAVSECEVFVNPSSAVIMEGCKGVTIGVLQEGDTRGVGELGREMRVFDFSWPGGSANPNYRFLE